MPFAFPKILPLSLLRLLFFVFIQLVQLVRILIVIWIVLFFIRIIEKTGKIQLSSRQTFVGYKLTIYGQSGWGGYSAQDPTCRSGWSNR